MSGGDILNDLDEADFSMKMRGYDQFEVDEMLDRASREITDLRGEAKAASDRADLAEARLEAELAAALEARSEAEAGLVEAEAEARAVLAGAATEAAGLRDAVGAELREAVDEGRRTLLAEIADLERARDAVRDDIGITEQHVAAHRARLQKALDDLGNVVGAMATRPDTTPSRAKGAASPADSEAPAPTVVADTGESKASPAEADPGVGQATIAAVPDLVSDSGMEPLRMPDEGGPSDDPVRWAGAVGGDHGAMEAFFGDGDMPSGR